MKDAFGIDRTDISKGLPSHLTSTFITTPGRIARQVGGDSVWGHKAYYNHVNRNYPSFSPYSLSPEANRKATYITNRLDTNEAGKFRLLGIKRAKRRGQEIRVARDKSLELLKPAPKTRPLRNI